MGVHLGGNVKGGGGVPDNGGVHTTTTEHGLIVHCYTITSIPVGGGVGESTRGMCGGVVVRAGRNQYGGGKGSSGGNSSSGRGKGGRVMEGTIRKTPGTEHQKIVQVSN